MSVNLELKNIRTLFTASSTKISNSSDMERSLSLVRLEEEDGKMILRPVDLSRFRPISTLSLSL